MMPFLYPRLKKKQMNILNVLAICKMYVKLLIKIFSIHMKKIDAIYLI